VLKVKVKKQKKQQKTTKNKIKMVKKIAMQNAICTNCKALCLYVTLFTNYPSKTTIAWL